VDQLERNLGEQVRRSRLSADMTQQSVADQAGVSLSALRSLELGHGSSLTTLVRVLRAIGQADWLTSLAPEPAFSPLLLMAEPRSGGVRRRASRRVKPTRGEA